MSYMDQRVSSSTHPGVRRESEEEENRLRWRERSYSPGNRRREYIQDRFRRSSRSRSRSRSRSPRRERTPEGHDEYEEVQPQNNYYDIPMDRPNNTVKVFFPIPEHCVGLVIGRSGSEIQQISNKSKCRVQVASDKSNTGYRMVEIEGFRDDIDNAKTLINEVVARSNLRVPQQNSLPSFRPAVHSLPQHTEKITIDIPIPAKKCGSVIGKGGETMKKLRTWSNCHIQLIQDNNLADQDKPLRITGDAKSVEQARRLVLDIIANSDELPAASFMAGNGPVATMTLQVKVPRSCVGAIMGLQGKNIRKLSDETATKIQFMPDNDVKLMERELAIIGNQNKVYVAAQLIKEIVDANNLEGNAPVSLFYMCVPASKCGLVIGRGGETIKQINAESGAHCELTRDPNQNPNEKTFVIRGSELQVEHAKHLICQKVGDIPPNTPFNSYAFGQPQQVQQAPQAPVVVQAPTQQIIQHPHQQQPPMMWNGQQMVPISQPAHVPVQPIYQVHPQQQVVPEWQQQQGHPIGQQLPTQYSQPTQQAQQPMQIPQQVPQHIYHQQMQVPQPQPQVTPVSKYAQFVGQIANHQTAPVQQHHVQQPTILQAAQPTTVGVSAPQNNDVAKKEETDYSSQWLEYYISIGDVEGANGVRNRIAKMEEEKALKQMGHQQQPQPRY